MAALSWITPALTLHGCGYERGPTADGNTRSELEDDPESDGRSWKRSRGSESANELWRRWRSSEAEGGRDEGKKRWDAHLAGGGSSSAGLVPLCCSSTLTLFHHLALSFSFAPSLSHLSPGLESVSPSNTLHRHIWFDIEMAEKGGSPALLCGEIT